MSVPARGLRFEAPSAELHAFDPDAAEPLSLDAGERICPPPERRGGGLGALLFIAVLLGGGWWLLHADTERLAWVGTRLADLAALVRPPPATDADLEPSSIAMAEAAPTEGLHAEAPMTAIPDAPETPAAVPVDIVPPDADDAAANSDDAPVETAALPATEPAIPEPLPAPTVDPADPYQRRAADAGLHPGLSRVVLARLSTADYRNARYAIDTAIAKTSDTGAFVWPRQRTPERALFKVHFVAGAAPGCRRYIVTVVKDGWSTTAMPMERCSAALAGSKAAR